MEYKNFANAFFAVLQYSLVMMFIYCKDRCKVDRANQ